MWLIIPNHISCSWMYFVSKLEQQGCVLSLRKSCFFERFHYVFSIFWRLPIFEFCCSEWIIRQTIVFDSPDLTRDSVTRHMLYMFNFFLHSNYWWPAKRPHGRKVRFWKAGSFSRCVNCFSPWRSYGEKIEFFCCHLFSTSLIRCLRFVAFGAHR